MCVFIELQNITLKSKKLFTSKRDNAKYPFTNFPLIRIIGFFSQIKDFHSRSLYSVRFLKDFLHLFGFFVLLAYTASSRLV